MKILYRPQRGGLDEAMEEVKEFATLKDMFEYVAKDIGLDEENDGVDEYGTLYCIDDLCISYYCYDYRIDWETYIVCDCSYDMCKKHGSPQAIGFCTFKE